MFHDEPNIIHIGRPGEGVALKQGMFFTIEPMINLGKPHVKILSDAGRGDPRSLAVGAIRAFGRRDHERRRNLHAVAAPAEKPPAAA